MKGVVSNEVGIFGCGLVEIAVEIWFFPILPSGGVVGCSVSVSLELVCSV